MADIIRVTSTKILGVTITNDLPASDHVREVISGSASEVTTLRRYRNLIIIIIIIIINSCAQTLYALLAHGMCQEALQTIFRSVTIIAALLYASSAW